MTYTLKIFTFIHFVFVALVTNLAYHSTELHADDTDLFFNATPAGIEGNPNVLFLLDNSVSMSNPTDCGEDDCPSRSQALRANMRELLTSISGIDVGVVVYNYYGASVIQPLKDLDGPPTSRSLSSAGTITTTSRISQSDHDVSIANDGSGTIVASTSSPVANVYTRHADDDPANVFSANFRQSGLPNSATDMVVRGSIPLSNEADIQMVNQNTEAALIFNRFRLPFSATRFIPLVSGTSFGTTFPSRIRLRFNLQDYANFADLRDGCVLEAFVELTSISDSPPPSANEPSLRVRHGTGNFTSPTILFQGSDGLNGYGLAADWRTIEIGDNQRFRTPNYADILDLLLEGFVFADTDTTNDYFYLSFDPRTVRDNNVSPIPYVLPSYLMGGNISGAPTIETFSHNAPSLEDRPILVFSYAPDCHPLAPTPTNPGDAIPNETHTFAMIFNDVRVPATATISDIRLRLFPTNDYLEGQDFTMSVRIGAREDADGIDWRQPLSGLTNTGSAVSWKDPGRASPDLGTLAAADTSDTPWHSGLVRGVASPNLSAGAPSTTSAQGWCGGQSWVVTISTDSPAAVQNFIRSFYTFDSDPLKAPRLDVTYQIADATDAAACNVFDVTVSANNLYAVNSTATDTDIAGSPPCITRDGQTAFTQNILDFSASATGPEAGIRFFDFGQVDIAASAEIISAELLLTADVSPLNYDAGDVSTQDLNPRSVAVRAHKPPNAARVYPIGPHLNNTIFTDSMAVNHCLYEYIQAEESTAPVNWDWGTDAWNNLPDATSDSLTVTSPDLSAIIEEVIENPTWANDQKMVLMLDASQTAMGATRNIYGNNVATRVPTLRIRYRGSRTSQPTYRQELLDFIDEMPFENRGTPIYSSLREAVSYLRHESIFAGLRRAPGFLAPPNPLPAPNTPLINTTVYLQYLLSINSISGLNNIAIDFTRASHPDTTSGGGINLPLGCDLARNPSNRNCFEVRLTDSTYNTNSSMSACDSNHIILLTDGQSNGYLRGNPSTLFPDWGPSFNAWIDTIVPADVSGGTCGSPHVCPPDLDNLEPEPSSVTPAEIAFDNRINDNLRTEADHYAQLAYYLSHPDYTSPNNADNDEPVTIHTIELGDTGANTRILLESLTLNSPGTSYTATNTEDLLVAFREILGTVGDGFSSLAAPSLTINAFNSLFTLDQIYISMFEPSSVDLLWRGNIKKYRLRTTCAQGETNCMVGELLDANNNPILGNQQVIVDTAQSFWSSQPDGGEVTLGGAAEVAMDAGTGFPILLVTDLNAPSGTELDDPDYRVINDRTNINMDILNELGIAGASNLDSALAWWYGTDSWDEDNDTNSGESRWLYQDSVHTNIVPIIFGQDSSPIPEPILKLFATTNAGEIKMLNSATGEEEWRYIPSHYLERAGLFSAPNSIDLSANPNANRLYGIDGALSSFIIDCNRDGFIQSSPSASQCSMFANDTPATEFDRDRVFVFAAERRGGNRIYAIEAVPHQNLGDPTTADPFSTTSVKPRFLWSIDSNTAGYSRLGQTWSEVVPMRIAIRDPNDNTQVIHRLVVAFSAGYDSKNDTQADADVPIALSSDTDSNLVGGAIYFADMLTGACIGHIGRVSEPNCTYNTVVADMKYSIAMTPGFLYSNTGGREQNALSAIGRAVDRLYFVDLGGQMFRIDTNVAQVLSGLGITVDDSNYFEVHKIADLGAEEDPTSATNNRQFYTSPIVVPVRGDTVNSTDPDYDLIALGSGTRPFPNSRGVQDRALVVRDYLADTRYTSVTFSDTSLPTPSPAVVVITADTDLLDLTADVNPTTADLRSKSGWYIDLASGGQKIISQGQVVAGTWFFTTFTPAGIIPSNQCESDQGTSLLFSVNIINAAPVNDIDQDGVLELSERSAVIGDGVVSDIATAYLEGGTVFLVNTQEGSRVLGDDLGVRNLDTPVVQSLREW